MNERAAGIFWIRLVMYLVLSLCIGSMYWDMGSGMGQVQDRVGILYFVHAFLSFMAVAALPAFIAERAVQERERRNELFGTGSYALSNFLAGLPFIFLMTLVCSLCIYFMSGFNQLDDGRFWVFTVDLFLCLVISESLMGLISVVVPHYIVGMALAGMYFGGMMLMEGFFILPDNLPDYWLWFHHVGFYTYANRVFLFNEFDQLSLTCDQPVTIVKGAPVCAFATGNDVLAFYDMQDTDVGVDLLVLVGNVVFYRLVFFLVLKFIRTGKR
jgi:ABC-type multidrug transport system permease subunit